MDDPAYRAGSQSPFRGCTALPSGKAERFGMGPPVVLGQRLTEGAGPVGHGPPADVAAGDRELGDGDRETA